MTSRRDLIRAVPALGVAILGASIAEAEAAPEPTRAERLADAMARAQAACAEITAILGQEWKPEPTAHAPASGSPPAACY
jgi:hypothetical protein